MGRGKYDTCENCKHGDKNRDGTYTCLLNRRENDNEPDHWCSKHKSEDED